MNKLIEKLNRQGFDVTNELEFNNITLARRRETFNWYLFISRDTSQLDSIRDSIMFKDIPLMYIGLKPNSEFTKEQVINGRFDMKRKRYKDKNITYCEVPESWLIE